MKILITGSNGLIARKLIKQLSKDLSNKIVATSQKPVHIEDAVDTFTVNLIYADINKLIDQVRPDVVIHCAAIGSPDACEVDRYTSKKINVEVSSRIAAACKDYGPYLIFLSTDFVFDGHKGNYVETDCTSPVSFYGETKVEAENAILGMDIGAAVIRTSMVYGFDNKLARPNLVLKLIDILKQGKPYRVPFDQIRTPTFAEDLAIAIEKLIAKKSSGIYHISGSEVINVADFSQMVTEIFSLNSSLLQPVTTIELAELSKRPLNSSLNIDKAMLELEFKPRTIAESLNIIKEQISK